MFMSILSLYSLWLFFFNGWGTPGSSRSLFVGSVGCGYTLRIRACSWCMSGTRCQGSLQCCATRRELCGLVLRGCLVCWLARRRTHASRCGPCAGVLCPHTLCPSPMRPHSAPIGDRKGISWADPRLATGSLLHRWQTRAASKHCAIRPLAATLTRKMQLATPIRPVATHPRGRGRGERRSCIISFHCLIAQHDSKAYWTSILPAADPTIFVFHPALSVCGSIVQL